MSNLKVYLVIPSNAMLIVWYPIGRRGEVARAVAGTERRCVAAASFVKLLLEARIATYLRKILCATTIRVLLTVKSPYGVIGDSVQCRAAMESSNARASRPVLPLLEARNVSRRKKKRARVTKVAALVSVLMVTFAVPAPRAFIKIN
jgi:hypothetical protein